MTTLTISRLGHHGDGIADGPVFVPLSLPGEEVEGTRDGDRLIDTRILRPSEHRVAAPCGHFKSCGGCALQHASDGFVADWKTEVIRTALAAHDIDVPLRPIATSPPMSRRRAVLSGRRTKKGALVGFHARKSDTIIALSECHLLAPELFACIPALAEITKLGGSRSATLSFALTLTDTGIDLQVRGGKPLDPNLQMALPQFRDRFARLTWEDEVVYMETAPILRFGAAALTPPPGAFLQATVHGEAVLQSAVADALVGATEVVDLFAGCGTFALPLAGRTPVHAVEGAAELLAALDHAKRHATGLKAVTTETRDLFRNPLDAEDLKHFDGAIIDPPRAGAEAQTRALAEAQIPRIAAVSCNPVTFARDAAMLIAAGYRLNWVQPVDQFRWSAHVELAACFTIPHLTGEE